MLLLAAQALFISSLYFFSPPRIRAMTFQPFSCIILYILFTKSFTLPKKGSTSVNGFEKQELETQGMMSKLFGSKPSTNALIEINNFLADNAKATDLTAELVQGFIKAWGAKFDSSNIENRSSMYRKVADHVYLSAQSKDDAVFNEAQHLASVLELPENLQRLADKGAKKVAYFARCRKLISGEEPLSIGEINTVFGYDYEDGYDIRTQVFHDYFNKKFDGIAEAKRFSPDDEQALRDICTKLDIPYEFKPNIQNALDKYRYLWSAENSPLGDIQVDFPLNEGEICHAAAQQAGYCEHKTVEKEDNYFELTRKLEIDETISFKGEKIEHPRFTEEVTAVVDVGYLFFTNQRVIYLSNKLAKIIDLNELEAADLSVNIIYFYQKDGSVMAIKFNDDVAEVMFAIFKRILSERQ